MNQDDMPLGDNFYQNPLEYMQNHVRNLNNEIFLSEYQINTLYALLLIGRNSPWDIIKGNSARIKEEVDLILNNKVIEVKIILEHLSNTYEDKSKKNAISQIERLMDILKSKKKSIFIEKDKSSVSFQKFKTLAMMAQQMEQEEKERKPLSEGNTQTEELAQEGQKIAEQAEVQAPKQERTHGIVHEAQLVQKQNEKIPVPKEENDGERGQQFQQREPLIQKESACTFCSHAKEQINLKGQAPEVEREKSEEEREKPEEEREKSEEEREKPEYVDSRPECLLHQKLQQKKGLPYDNGKEVFSIFYGLSNMSNLTAMALTNVVEYNQTERFLKFKMSDSYYMTIKSEDPYHFDNTSQFRKAPQEMFVSHIFPYLTASELFMCRSVCRQWFDYVKESWHATFKRQMFIQLLACEFCKDIEFFYKTIQLRNPFFQKISLLIHALIEIINWEIVGNLIRTNTLSLQMKKLLVILLRLIGQEIPLTNLNALNDAFYDQHKEKLTNIKQKVSQFFSSLSGSDLSIDDLRRIKTNFLDDHFMRVEEVSGTDDKTPLLINLLVKQVTLQQILRNHIYLAQEYLLNTKKRLDNISKKMVYQKGYLEGVYKILLLKSTEPFSAEGDANEMPNFNDMIQSIFTNRNCERPDFVLRGKNSSTEIYLDNQTKLDIILSTVYNINKGKSNEIEPSEQKLQKVQSEERQQLSEQERRERQQKNEIVNSIDMKIEISHHNAEEVKPEIPDLQKKQETN